MKDEFIQINFTQVRLSKYEYRDALQVQATPRLPPGCRHGSNEIRDYYDFSSRHELPDGDRLAYMGDFYDLHLGPWPDVSNADYMYGESRHWDIQQDNPAGCPSVGIIISKTSRNGINKGDVTTLLCSQMIQQVSVNVTHNEQDFSRPGRVTGVVEDSARNLTNGTEGVDTFPYRVQTYLDGKSDTHDVGNLTLFPSEFDTTNAFINHLIFAPNSTAPHDLVGKANRQTFIKTANDLYARYMCLVVDMHFRKPVPENQRAQKPGDDGYLEGSARDFSSRLRVDNASKLTMQIILAVMSALGALTFALTDLRGTLPRKPTSIASKMALLAGSEVCDERRNIVPPNATWMSEKELGAAFDGYLFSLGWWRRWESDDDGRTGETTVASDDRDSAKADEQRRFGIDVGVPEQLGFRDTKWWGLRRRFQKRVGS